MSQNRQIARKLRAFEAKKAIPKYSTIHLIDAPNPAFLAFVRMSGETRPWGIAFGTRADGPKFFTVDDGRNRVEIDAILEEFAIGFLDYFRVENRTFKPIAKDDLGADNPPQVWVPNSSHIDMLHFINYSHWKPRDEDDLSSLKPTLARLCGWLFRESKFTGQQLIIDSAAALRDHYVFPVDDVTISNPSMALEWLEDRDSIEEHVAESRKWGEDAAGTTLQPDVERKLEPLMDRVNPKSAEIQMLLIAELERRWQTAALAHEALMNDLRPSNDGAGTLLVNSLNRFVFSFQSTERRVADPDSGKAFTPHPETDNHGSAAAASYYDMQAADSQFFPALVHFDEEMLKDALYSGHAIAGVVQHITIENTGPRSREIYWRFRVQARDDFRLREGESMAPMGDNKHSVKIKSLTYVNETQVDLELHWTARKTTALTSGPKGAPADLDWSNELVYFVPADSSQFDRQNRTKVWKAREGRGAWLTHGKSVVSADTRVIDDIRQIEGDK